MKTFNKREYNIEYRRKALAEKKKAQFNTDLFYNEKIELDVLLKEHKMSKADFVRKGKRLLELGYMNEERNEAN